MMLRRSLKTLALIVCLSAVSNTAQAITVGGVEYEKFLTVTTDEKLGYWISMNKFYTYGTQGGNTPVSVSSVPFESAAIAALSPQRVYAMGTTAGKNGPVNNAVVEILGPGNEKLLTANLIPNGTLTTIRKTGFAGEIAINGLFNLTGGAYAGLVSGPLYIEIVFDKITHIARKDIHSSNGTFTFYSRSGGNTEIPEPATIVLLGSSLLGAVRLRRKKSA